MLSVTELPNTCFALWKDYKMQGIQFSTQGIMGIQAGVKTMFREPIESAVHGFRDKKPMFFKLEGTSTTPVEIKSKYKIGETVFVQEEFAEIWGSVVYKKLYRTSNDIHEEFWQPASEMTEQQSRFKIKFTGIKAEFLQDISEEDCIKEGAVKFRHLGVDMFKSINSNTSFDDCRYWFEDDAWQPLPYPLKYQWSANPPVFAYTFEMVS